MASTRLTAAERGEQLIAAAITAFASKGYAGTTTDDVARLVGVSQPYVIRLFGSKERLFLAAVERTAARIEAAFREAAAHQPTLESLAGAYNGLLAERDLLTMLLHGFAASSDPAIGPVVRDCFGRTYQAVREMTGASSDEIRDFMATGMLLAVLASMNIVGRDPVPLAPWMSDLISSIERSMDPPPPAGLR